MLFFRCQRRRRWRNGPLDRHRSLGERLVRGGPRGGNDSDRNRSRSRATRARARRARARPDTQELSRSAGRLSGLSAKRADRIIFAKPGTADQVDAGNASGGGAAYARGRAAARDRAAAADCDVAYGGTEMIEGTADTPSKIRRRAGGP